MGPRGRGGSSPPARTIFEFLPRTEFILVWGKSPLAHFPILSESLILKQNRGPAETKCRRATLYG